MDLWTKDYQEYKEQHQVDIPQMGDIDLRFYQTTVKTDLQAGMCLPVFLI